MEGWSVIDKVCGVIGEEGREQESVVCLGSSVP